MIITLHLCIIQCAVCLVARMKIGTFEAKYVFYAVSIICCTVDVLCCATWFTLIEIYYFIWISSRDWKNICQAIIEKSCVVDFVFVYIYEEMHILVYILDIYVYRHKTNLRQCISNSATILLRNVLIIALYKGTKVSEATY